MILSPADLKWDELVSIINKLHNPVLVARHFQYRVEVFFKEIAVDGPLGKTKNYAVRVEFQVPGSPHVHCFLWVANAPVLISNNKEEYITLVDQIFHAFVPDRNENPELHNLVNLYQLHRHSRTCRKYKNEPYSRFKFAKFFSKKKKKNVAEPLPVKIPEEIKVLVLLKKSQILDKVRDYINNFLDTSKLIFYEITRDIFIEVK